MDGCIVVQVHLQWNKVKCNNTVFCIILEACRIWPPDAVQEFTLILNKHNRQMKHSFPVRYFTAHRYLSYAQHVVHRKPKNSSVRGHDRDD